MSYDSKDDDVKLTKEYKYLLSNIRPLIDQLDKSKDARLCLLWLSKLEQCGRWERHCRNQILSEICKQVKSKCLKSPFNAPPPNGPLQNITLGLCKVSELNIEEFSEDVSTEPEVTSSSLASANSTKYQSSCSPSKDGLSCLSPKIKNKTPQKISKEMADHSECFAIQKAYHERAQSDQMVIERYQSVIKSLLSQQLKVDISPNKLKKLQGTYETKVAELMNSLSKVQEENDILKRKLYSYKDDVNNVNTIKKENESLKLQVKDLKVTQDKMEINYKKTEEEKITEMSNLMSKLCDTEKKLKESEKRFKNLEKNFKDIQHVNEIKHNQQNQVEKKFLAQLNTLKDLIEEKNKEILNLKEQMSNQSAHYEEEISRLRQEYSINEEFCKDKKKIKVLKSKTKKLEKIRENMAVLFHSQLQQIIAKKDFYISTLEMQLKMFNAEAGENHIGGNMHSILLQKVSTLEEQYRKLLQDTEQQAIRRRQLDLQKIHTLEKQLLLCGGVVEDNETTLQLFKSKSLTSLTAVDNDFSSSQIL